MALTLKLVLAACILSIVALALALVAQQASKSPSAVMVYVATSGSDANDGSQRWPFLTIGRAMASITDASDTKRYAVVIGPGVYTEGLVHLKANVQILGASTMLTRLFIPFDLDTTTWAGANDARSGFTNLTLLSGPLDFNFRTAQSTNGRLFFVSVGVDPPLTFTALSNSGEDGNQVNIRDSQLSGGFTQNGLNLAVFASWIAAGTITVNSQADTETLTNLVGGGVNGNVVVNVQPSHIGPTVNLTSFAISTNLFASGGGELTVNGQDSVATTVNATADSLPIRTRITLVGLATSLVRIDDAFGLAYAPANLADWSNTAPVTVQGALDRIAAALGPIS